MNYQPSRRRRQGRPSVGFWTVNGTEQVTRHKKPVSYIVIIIIVVKYYQERDGKIRNTLKNLGRKTKHKRPLGNIRHKWKGNFGICMIETGCDCVEWILLTSGGYK
jgi:hypothetical protein